MSCSQKSQRLFRLGLYFIPIDSKAKFKGKISTKQYILGHRNLRNNIQLLMNETKTSLMRIFCVVQC